MIEVKNLKKVYGNKIAVDNVSFSIKDREIVGFLGPNGAGKSTTMNIITGYISSNEGTVEICGNEILKNPIAAKSKIGYLPEVPPLYLDMTVKEYLSFMFDLKKVKLDKSSHISDICKKVSIDDVTDRLIKNLSKGYKQRVGLAQALLGNPPLLILDEPTVGLDPKQIIEIRDLIKSLKKDHTIILSSHILPEIQSTCDRIIVINKGAVVADDTTENLTSNVKSETKIIAQIQGDKSLVIETLKSISEISDVQVLKEKAENLFEYSIFAANENVRQTIFRSLAKVDCPIIEIKVIGLDLENVFLQLTKEENNNDKDLKESSESIEINEGGNK